MNRYKIRFNFFLRDLTASIVVFFVALPFSMGVAVASGVPAIYGILSGVVGALIVSPLAGAPLAITGPAAGLIVVVWEIVNHHGIEMLGPVVLVSGLLQIIGGLFLFGKWFKTIIPSITYGLLAGIGVLIIATQSYVIFNIEPKDTGLESLMGLPELFFKAFTSLSNEQKISGATGVLAIIIMKIWNKIPKLSKVPSSLVSVIIISAICHYIFPEIKKIEFSLTIFERLEYISLSKLYYVFSNYSALVDVVILTLVASTQGMLTVLALDELNKKHKSNFDKELMAQGVGNFVNGVFGFLPVTAVPVRTVANFKSGAYSRLSGVMQGFWLIILCLIFPAIIEKIPVTVLAAILIYVGFQIVNIQNFKIVLRKGRYSVFIYFATACGVIFVNIVTGVVIGFILAVINLLHQMTNLSVRVIKEADLKTIHIYLDGSATFMSLPILTEALDKIKEDVDLFIHIRDLKFIDQACLDALAKWEENHLEKGGHLKIKWEELFKKLPSTNKV